MYFYKCIFTFHYNIIAAQVLQVREGPLATVSVNEIEFNIRVLSFNRRVDLYSIDIQLSVHGENEVCLIFLMGDDSDIAVASNVVRSALNAVFAIILTQLRLTIVFNQHNAQYKTI